MKDDLEERMKKAGMLSISEMLDNNPLGEFSVQVGVRNLETFEEWLKMRHKEILEMKAKMVLDKKEDDDMFEWVMSHEAVFNEVRCNLRAAKKESNRIEEANIKFSDIKNEFSPEQYYVYEGDDSHCNSDLLDNRKTTSKIVSGMRIVVKITLTICIIGAIYKVLI